MAYARLVPLSREQMLVAELRRLGTNHQQLKQSLKTPTVPVYDDFPGDAVDGQIALKAGAPYYFSAGDWLPFTPAETELRVYSLAGVRSIANGTFNWWPAKDGTLTFVQIGVSTPPTGAGLTVRINLNGTSVGTVTIAAGANTATFVPSTTAFAALDHLSVDVTAANGGADLEVQFWGAYS